MARWVKRGARWIYVKSPVGLSRKRYFSPIDFIPGVGPVRKARKAWKYRKVPGKAGKWVFAGTLDLGGDLLKYGGYRKYKSRGRSSKSSQRSGYPRGTKVSGFGRSPSARKRSIRRAKASRRGDRWVRAERILPWCSLHGKRHWCWFTRK